MGWGSWTSGYSNNSRVGIWATVSGTTVSYEYWVEFQYSVSDNMTLHRNGAVSGDVGFNKQGPAAVLVSSGSFAGSRGTTYYLGAWLSGVYNGAHSSCELWVTVPAAAPNAPGQNAISHITPTGLRVNGTVPANNGSSINLWEFSRATNSAGTQNRVDVTHSGHILDLTGLAKGTTYWTWVRARNGVGWSAWSAARSATTGTTVPGAASGPLVSGVTASGATVARNGVFDDGGLAITNWQYQIARDSAGTDVVQTTESTAVSIPVTGLSAASTYYARVRAYNSNGWGAWSAASTFTTSATVPGQVLGLSAKDTTQDRSTVSWSAPGDGGSTITGYSLQIATNAAFTVGLQTFSVSGLSRDVTGLTPGTTYYIRVRAINAVGNGAYSTTANFTTVSGKPTIVNSATLPLVRTNGRLGATVYAQGWSGNFTITVHLATSSAFSSYTTLTLSPTAVPNSLYDVLNSTLQANGTYYVRARVKNNTTSYESDWSDTVSYTQSHTPSAVGVSPTADAWLKYAATVPFSVRFSDLANPLDQMTALQIVVENNSSGAAIVDTGKTAKSSSGTNPTVVHDVAIPAAQKNVKLRWKVRVWDSSDQVSAYSSYHIFQAADAPVVTIVTPTAGGPVTVGNPNFSFTRTFPSGGTQKSATYVVVDQVTGAIAWSYTDTLASSTSAQPGTVVLQNGRSYTLSLTVTDSRNLSTTETRSFTVSYVSPDTVDYEVRASAEDLRERGYVLLDWSATAPDTEILSWVVYRRKLPSTNWELVAEIFDTAQSEYHDYMIEGGTSYQWNVTQRANRSGATLESPVGWVVEPVSWDEPYPGAWSGAPAQSPTRVNLATNPGFRSLGASFVYRTNLARNPVAGAPAVGDFAAVAVGTGESATLQRVAGALDGPVLPDGSMLTSYARRNVTVAKTGGSTGPSAVHSSARAQLSGVSGDVVTLSLYVRYSGADALLPRLRVGFYTGGGALVSQSDTAAGEISLTAADGWVRISHTATAGGTFATAGWWLYNLDASEGQVQAAGTNLDCTGLLVESGDRLQPFFYGSYSPDPDFTPAWSGAVNASASTLTGRRPANVGYNSASRVTVTNRGGKSWVRSIPAGANWSVAHIAGSLSSLSGRGVTLTPGKWYGVTALGFLPEPQGGALHSFARRLRLTSSHEPMASGSTVISQVTQALPNVTGEHRLSGAFLLPANSIWVELVLWNGASAGNGDVYWTDLMIIEGDSEAEVLAKLDPYFDGDSGTFKTQTGWHVVNEWNGTQNLSSSTETRTMRTRDIIPENRISQISLDGYWIICEDDPALTFALPPVTADSFSDEYESESVHVLGRGRHRDYGDRIGYAGSMTLSLRGAAAVERRWQIEALRRQNARLWLRKPFNDLFPVAFGDPQVSILPHTGDVEMSDMTLPYEEVYE